MSPQRAEEVRLMIRRAKVVVFLDTCSRGFHWMVFIACLIMLLASVFHWTWVLLHNGIGAVNLLWLIYTVILARFTFWRAKHL